MSKYESLWQYWSLVSRWILMICENLTIVRLHQSIDYVFCCPCASLYFWSVETDCVQLCNSVLSYDTFSSTVMFFWCSLFASQHCWCSFLLNYFTFIFHWNFDTCIDHMVCTFLCGLCGCLSWFCVSCSECINWRVQWDIYM